MSEHDYCVYMLTNQSHRVLYTGVTNNLVRRLHEHRAGSVDGFTKKYRCHKLVYAEFTSNIVDAIAREKHIKGWLRSKKNALVASINPEWHDLGKEWALVSQPMIGHPEHREGSRLFTLDSSPRSE
jgi:putative endonuclease